jgi:hypothetical protein
MQMALKATVDGGQHGNDTVFFFQKLICVACASFDALVASVTNCGMCTTIAECAPQLRNVHHNCGMCPTKHW